MTPEPGDHVAVEGTIQALDTFWRGCLLSQLEAAITRPTLRTPEGSWKAAALMDTESAWTLFTPGGTWRG